MIQQEIRNRGMMAQGAVYSEMARDDIQDAMDRLEKSLHTLQEVGEKLLARLGPVLRAPINCAAEPREGVQTSIQSPLSIGIRNLAEVVDCEREKLVGILERLDL